MCVHVCVCACMRVSMKNPTSFLDVSVIIPFSCFGRPQLNLLTIYTSVCAMPYPDDMHMYI